LYKLFILAENLKNEKDNIQKQLTKLTTSKDNIKKNKTDLKTQLINLKSELIKFQNMQLITGGTPINNDKYIENYVRVVLNNTDDVIKNDDINSIGIQIHNNIKYIELVLMYYRLCQDLPNLENMGCFKELNNLLFQGLTIATYKDIYEFKEELRGKIIKFIKKFTYKDVQNIINTKIQKIQKNFCASTSATSATSATSIISIKTPAEYINDAPDIYPFEYLFNQDLIKNYNPF
jgi:hypothetical protein